MYDTCRTSLMGLKSGDCPGNSMFSRLPSCSFFPKVLLAELKTYILSYYLSLGSLEVF